MLHSQNFCKFQVVANKLRSLATNKHRYVVFILERASKHFFDRFCGSYAGVVTGFSQFKKVLLATSEPFLCFSSLNVLRVCCLVWTEMAVYYSCRVPKASILKMTFESFKSRLCFSVWAMKLKFLEWVISSKWTQNGKDMFDIILKKVHEPHKKSRIFGEILQKHVFTKLTNSKWVLFDLTCLLFKTLRAEVSCWEAENL